MPSVELDDQEWQQVMNILIQSHPLLMKIAAQLRAQTPVKQMSEAEYEKAKHSNSGKEAQS